MNDTALAYNDFGVPKKQWDKWSANARRVFSDTYYAMTHSQHLFRHPKADVVPEEHWKTTSWNAAWVAAEAVDRR